MLRRDVVKLLMGISAVVVGGLIKPVKTLAAWNDAAFNAQNLDKALAEYYPGKRVLSSDDIVIGVRTEIENGAVVPVKVTTTLTDVTSIALFVEKNPNPLIANFDLSPNCNGFVSSRIKMDQSSELMAVVVSAGQPYSSKTFVTVHQGGCA